MDTDTAGDGPIDVVMLSFPGNRFNGAVAPALRDLVVRGLVRVVDLLFGTKDEDGTVGSIELANVEIHMRQPQACERRRMGAYQMRAAGKQIKRRPSLEWGWSRR